jgi:fumarate reductase subunit C
MRVYTEYHHRWLRRPVSTYWWLEKRSYFAFILREASCVFVAWFVAFLLLLLRAALQGGASYEQWLEWAASPAILLLNVVTLAFMVYHAVTFFDAAPQALVVRLGRRRVPPAAVRAGHYVAWAAASGFIAWLVMSQ